MVKDIKEKKKVRGKWLQDSERVCENFLENMTCWKRKRFMTGLDGDNLIAISETVENEQEKSLWEIH